jgi:hypothetical protein
MCVWCVKHYRYHSRCTLYRKHVSRIFRKICPWALADKPCNTGFVRMYGKTCLWKYVTSCFGNATSKNAGAAAERINKPIHVSSTTSLAPEAINSDLMTQITASRQLDAIPPPSNTFSVHTPPTGSLCGPFSAMKLTYTAHPGSLSASFVVFLSITILLWRFVWNVGNCNGRSLARPSHLRNKLLINK